MSISTVTSCRSKGYLFVFMGGDFESDNYEFGRKNLLKSLESYTLFYTYSDNKECNIFLCIRAYLLLSNKKMFISSENKLLLFLIHTLSMTASKQYLLHRIISFQSQ